MSQSLDIVILGLSITSSWGNGHLCPRRGRRRAVGHPHRAEELEGYALSLLNRHVAA